MKRVLVLVVDLDRIRRRATERLLVELGHRVVGVADRNAAIAMVAESDCDLVLADAGIAAIDGFEVVRTMRRHWRHIPVVVIVPVSASLEQAFAAGASACIPEPPTVAALHRVLGFPFVRRAAVDTPGTPP